MKTIKKEYYKWFVITDDRMKVNLTIHPLGAIGISFDNLSSHNTINLKEIGVEKVKTIIKILNKVVEVAEDNLK